MDSEEVVLGWANPTLYQVDKYRDYIQRLPHNLYTF